MAATGTRREIGGGWQLKGKHVLLTFIVFFGVIFAVNGVFVFKALSTYTGIVSVEPYRKGLAYNDRIAAEERQKALGWQDAMSLDGDGRIVVRMTDAGGMPVAGLTLHAVLGRPATERMDQALVLAETGAGVYEGTATSAAPGAWLLTVRAFRDSAAAEPDFRARKRLWVKP